MAISVKKNNKEIFKFPKTSNIQYLLDSFDLNIKTNDELKNFLLNQNSFDGSVIIRNGEYDLTSLDLTKDYSFDNLELLYVEQNVSGLASLKCSFSSNIKLIYGLNCNTINNGYYINNCCVNTLNNCYFVKNSLVFDSISNCRYLNNITSEGKSITNSSYIYNCYLKTQTFSNNNHIECSFLNITVKFYENTFINNCSLNLINLIQCENNTNISSCNIDFTGADFKILNLSSLKNCLLNINFISHTISDAMFNSCYYWDSCDVYFNKLYLNTYINQCLYWSNVKITIYPKYQSILNTSTTNYNGCIFNKCSIFNNVFVQFVEDESTTISGPSFYILFNIYYNCSYMTNCNCNYIINSGVSRVNNLNVFIYPYLVDITYLKGYFNCCAKSNRNIVYRNSFQGCKTLDDKDALSYGYNYIV